MIALASALLAACGSESSASVSTSAAASPKTRGVALRPINGGPSYFAHKDARSAWLDDHILLGAWLEQPQTSAEVGYDARMGENIYWNLAASPGKNRVDYNVIRAWGMHVSAPDTSAKSGSETVAYEGMDEADMDFGPGSAAWNPHGGFTSSACIPAGSRCGYTVANFFYSGQPTSYGSPGYPINNAVIHQGYGKGVLFWESDQQAAKFVRDSDILSADSYWITDSDLQTPSQGGCALQPSSPTACGRGGGHGLTTAQSRLPANYQYDVTRLEHLAAISGTSKPVVVDVETGCPLNNGACTTPPQMTASAWHALIAGARGIIWFQHNFSGPCVDFRTFVDGSNHSSSMYNCQQTPGVTLHDVVRAVSTFDHEVTSLNRVLLSPTAVGLVHTHGDVSTLSKLYGGACYVFAGSGKPATPPPANQSVTFRLAGDYTGLVHVYDEHRTIEATHGVFRDVFADANAVHVYRIKGDAACSQSSAAGSA
jgi:hypothetical protein